MTPIQLFVITGKNINSAPVIDALEKTQKNDREKGIENRFTIIPVAQNNLKNILDDPKTVGGFLPGSDSSQNIRDQIGHRGLDHLHDFVAEDGGAVTGFCAGGYLLGKKIIYGTCFPKQYQRRNVENIGLIDATYYGPLSHLLLDYAFKHPENPYISTTSVFFTPKNSVIPVETHIAYWHGGVPLLAHDQKELRVLASFPKALELNVQEDACTSHPPIAIGVKDFPVNGGKAISSAVHAELRGVFLENYIQQMTIPSKHESQQQKHYRALRQTYQTTAELLKYYDDSLNGLFGLIVDEMLDCGKAQRLAI